jgi:outer membrane protein assembly factor BamB
MELLTGKKLLFPIMALAVISCSGTFKYRDEIPVVSQGWNSFRGDQQNTAYLPHRMDTPNQLLWKYDFGKPAKSTPVIVGRILVIGSLTKRVRFLDASTGKHLGAYKISSGVSTSACAEAPIIYFGTDQGKETMFAFDLKNGKDLWKKNIVDISSSPVLYEDKLLVGSGAGILWALDRQTGDLVWRFKTSGSVISTPACHASSGDNSYSAMICFGSTNGRLYALESDSGSVIWEFDAGAGIYTSPAIKNGKVFFGSSKGELHALNLNDGSQLWSYKIGTDLYSSPAVADSLVYFGSNDYCMYALNQNDGKLVWKYRTSGLIRSSPIAVGDMLFFGSYDGNFYVLDRFSGKLLWKYQTKGMISSSPAYSDGKVYIASEDGHLYCFGP